MNKRLMLSIAIAVLLVAAILLFIRHVKDSKNNFENATRIKLLKELSFRTRKNKLSLNEDLSELKNENDNPGLIASGIMNYQQRIDELIYNGLEFNLGETKEEIIKNLGKPLKVVEKSIVNQHQPEITDKLYDLIYEGFVIRIYHATTDDKELVLRIIIENDKYKVKYGLNIGVTEDFILGILGPPFIKEENRYEYSDSNGFARLRFIFESGNLIKIEWDFDEN